MLELLLSCALSGQPNIIFFLSDDHACNAVGAYGSVINETPHIDRLAAEGATFDRAFCNNGICAPSRAAFLTGVHGYINGVETNGDRFDGSQPTIASTSSPSSTRATAARRGRSLAATPAERVFRRRRRTHFMGRRFAPRALNLTSRSGRRRRICGAGAPW